MTKPLVDFAPDASLVNKVALRRNAGRLFNGLKALNPLWKKWAMKKKVK
jgi:hypothetical protein